MARRIRLDLLSNAGTGAGAGQDWPGGEGAFYVSAATFGGGNIALQYLAPDGNWIPLNHYGTVTPIAVAAVGMAYFKAPAASLRAVSTTATGVFAGAVGIPDNVAG